MPDHRSMGPKGPVTPNGAQMRIARPEEAEAVRALYRAAFAGDVARLGYRPSPMDADYDVLFKQNYVLALGAPGDLLGAVVTAPRRNYLYIEAIALRPGQRRKGGGRRLLNNAEQLAGELCLPEVRLHTVPILTDALQFYASCGYREVDRSGRGALGRSLFVKRVPTALDRLLGFQAHPLPR